jgi:predicted nucleic acid-binding Zn finger protein
MDIPVEVWLERLDSVDDVFIVNTWVLTEAVEYALHTSGKIGISTTVFRTHLAYVDIHQQIHMDDSGARVVITPNTPISLFRIGEITLGPYTLDLSRRYCSCKSYQYLRTERGDRNCKHLNSLCRPSYDVTFTKQKQSFQLISETVPKHSYIYTDWIYSRKYDGIRVRVDGNWAWTRGGMKIDLTSIWTPPIGHIYDAELCVAGNETGTHDDVLALMLAGKMESLRLMIFDLFDLTGNQTCGQRMLLLWNLPIPTENLVRYYMVDLWKGLSFHTRLAQMNIGSASCEGVVVRNPCTIYDGSGKRNNRSIFKVKQAQWNKLQIRTYK